MDPFLAMLTQPTVPIRRHREAVPAPLVEVIDHDLTEEPQIGLRTADELSSALARAHDQA
jgi:hypothetical protein